jgi:mono/diheme cytochrome c family protein
LRTLSTIAAILTVGLTVLSHAAQQTPPSASLTATERVGERLFLQRCSLCHLGSAPTYKPYGPALDGLVAAKGVDEVRTVIADGSPGMPAWRYSLQPSDIDAIIAYMRKLGRP